jgi:hypothetical protein
MSNIDRSNENPTQIPGVSSRIEVQRAIPLQAFDPQTWQAFIGAQLSGSVYRHETSGWSANRK